MRIVSGIYGGRRLVTPKGRDIRPTSDKVRGAVFNMLDSLGVVDGANVLDGFCGTGALGLEALSRGAAHCTFVDKAKESLSLCRENSERLDALSKADFILGDLTKFSAEKFMSAPFDLVFLDPPYNQSLVPSSLTKLVQAKILKHSAVIVAETERTYDIDPEGSFKVHKVKEYGEIRITVLLAN